MNPGDLISGKYRLLRQLGAGGMGSVWAARNELTDRDFAIKFLLPDLARNKEALHRFFLEARACGQIKHPAIVDVYDMGQAEDGSPYLVMELLEGEGFDQRLARDRIFPAAEAAAWIAFVARGLDEAHNRGLVHRDLKPGNIFFALDDRGDVMPKVLDFGVSKASGVRSGSNFVKTTTGAVLGSPAYMSPEQAQGETDVDARSDVWSLGVMLYEAITGQVPFDAPNYNALMVAIMMRPHRPVSELAPNSPLEIAEVIDHALAKDKTARIGTARELAERLEAAVARLGGQNYPQFQPRQTTMGMGSVPPGPTLATQTPLPQLGPDATGPQRPNSTTQGPWSDARPTLRRRPPLSPFVWIGFAVLGIGGLVAGAFGFMYLRQPVAAVAGRSSAALTTGLSRLQSQLDHVQADMAEERRAEEAKAREAAAPPTAKASTTVETPASAAPSTAPAPVHPPAQAPAQRQSPRPRKPANDPHGGVDSAGF